MKRTILISALALPALFFLSCNNAGTSAAATPATRLWRTPTFTTVAAIRFPGLYPTLYRRLHRYDEKIWHQLGQPKAKDQALPGLDLLHHDQRKLRADSLMAYLKEQIENMIRKDMGKP